MADFKVSGEDFISAVADRLNDEDIRCYDSAIVRQVRKMTAGQLWQIVHFGDVTEWHNYRIRKAGQSDYKDKS